MGSLLRERTGGNPLFAEALIDYWRASGAVRFDDGRWLKAMSAQLDLSYLLALVAEVQLEAGLLQQASATLDEALALVDRSRTFFYEAELVRLQPPGRRLAQRVGRRHDQRRRAVAQQPGLSDLRRHGRAGDLHVYGAPDGNVTSVISAGSADADGDVNHHRRFAAVAIRVE